MKTAQEIAETLYQKIINMGYPPKAGDMYQWIIKALEEYAEDKTKDYANKWLQGPSNDKAEELYDLVKTVAKDPSFTRFNILAEQMKHVIMLSRKEGFEEGYAKGYVQGQFDGENRQRDKAYMGELWNQAIEKTAKMAEEVNLNVHPDCGRSVAKIIRSLAHAPTTNGSLAKAPKQ